jgi:restriction system protein
MARSKDHLLNDLYEIAAVLSWWVSVLSAVLAYAVLHNIASTSLAAPTTSPDMAFV